MTNKFLPTLLVLGLSANAASAAFFYSVETDASGNFVNSAGAPGIGSWAGDGTVVGAAGYLQTSGNTLISGFSSGTLQPGSMATFTGQPAVGGVGNLNWNTGVTMTMDMDLGSGTGDLDINTFTHGGTGNLYPNGFDIRNTMGVDCIDVEFNWSDPLAANFGTIPGNRAPFLAAFRGSQAEVTATYLGLSHTTTTTAPVTSFSPGLPSSASAVDMSLSSSNWATDGATSSWTYNAGGGAWQGIHGFDLNGGSYVAGTQNNGTIEDAEQVYATGIRYSLKPIGGGTFADGSSFIFSTNGGQWRETAEAAATIPEPSRAALLALAGFVLITRRRR